jgi:hypothetical protein
MPVTEKGGKKKRQQHTHHCLADRSQNQKGKKRID